MEDLEMGDSQFISPDAAKGKKEFYTDYERRRAQMNND
jgi:hypothetical protein